MQCTSFLPGCYSRGDPNVSANGGVFPLYNNEMTLVSGNSYNAFLPPPNSDQLLVYQKEVLRQTMLKHECIFRDQVHELHRLYRRQRELMEEIKKRELSKQNLQLQTSQSNLFLPKISSESSQSMCLIPSLPWLDPASSRLLSISGVENFQATSFLWKRTTTGRNAAQTEGDLKDCKLSHSESRKPKKKMLDLELPADEYIDSDEDNLVGQENVSNVPYFSPKRIPEVSQKGDFKLVPCDRLVNSICQGGHLSPVPFSRSNELTDLNYPICLNDGASSNSIDNLGSETYVKGIPCPDQDQDQSNLGFRTLSKEIVSCSQTGRAVVTCSKSMQAGKDSQQELLPRIDEAGQTICNLNSFPQVSSSGKLCTPFKRLEVELPAEFPLVNLLDESGGKLQDQGSNSVVDTLERKHNLSNDDYRGLASSCLPTLYKLVPQCDVMKSEPSVSSQRKPAHNLMQNPTAVQALPCFNIAAPSSKSTKSLDVSPLFNKNRSHFSKNVSRPTVGSLNPLGDSFCAVSTADACLQSINLDHLDCSAVTCSPPEVETICFPHSSGRDASSAKVMDLNFPPSILLDSEVFQQNVGTEDGVKNLEDSQAVLPGSREKLNYCNKPDEEGGDLSRADLVFSHSLPTSICDFKPERFKTSECSDAPENKDIIVNSKLSGVGNQFDLNSCVDDSSPTLSIPNGILKTVAEIDPEAPVSPENKECSPPRGVSEDNQLGTPVQLSKQEDRDQNNELVRMAAEAIVSISTTWFQKSLIENTVGKKTLEDSHCDSLHWFAGLVSSVAGDLENGAGVVLGGEHDRYYQELSSDGSDYFEAMTLELTETMVEEYCCKSYGPKHERSCVVSSHRQPRRERMRRGRQRKDFQAEVLPSLASLSRNEVTMDLQAIGGLMEAAGLPVETSLGRRNAGRGSRPRRRSCNSSCHGNDTELSVTGERTLKGWGKTNRRRRGPRIAASNPQHILSYVYHQ